PAPMPKRASPGPVPASCAGATCSMPASSARRCRATGRWPGTAARRWSWPTAAGCGWPTAPASPRRPGSTPRCRSGPAAAASASGCPAAAIPTRSSTCCRIAGCRHGGARTCRCCSMPPAPCWPPPTSPCRAPWNTGWANAACPCAGWRPARRVDPFRPTAHTCRMPKNDALDASPVAQFEQSLDELEQLVEKMEQGEMSLEDSLAAYERGVGLYRRCQGALEQAELRVRLLTDPERPEDAQPFGADDGA